MESLLTSSSADDIAALRAKIEKEKTEVDLFVEQCSSLYNLILDALHEQFSSAELSLQCALLEEMAAQVERAGDRLAEQQPDTEGTVQLRMHTISSALEQLRLRRGTAGGTSTDSESTASRSSASCEVRNWLQRVERRLQEHEQRYYDGCVRSKLLADHQVLQLEIQSDGQAFISRLEQQFLKSEGYVSDSECGDRRRVFVDSLRKRWYAAYLNSLSLQIRVEEDISRLSETSDSDAEADFVAPPVKRARHYSNEASDTESEAASDEDEDEDTFAFAPSECRRLMEAPNVSADSASDAEPAEARKWGSAHKDVGYSSGDNSIPEALNRSADQQPVARPREIATKIIGKTPPFNGDSSEPEVEKFLDIAKPEDARLSDSMIVNCEHGNTTLHGTDFDDVLRLMDDDDVGMTDSFHTEWREIRADAQRRRSRNERHAVLGALLGKASCDASSEESEDMEALVHDSDACVQLDASPMSRSMISSVTLASTPSHFGSLKRGRGQRSQLLDGAEMDASFCSTRSELVPGRQPHNVRLRKRLRIRRLPRSMSDGEQLGIGASRTSPPSTPLARSTRLLQRLDEALQARDSDTTAPEQSDAAAYEWDDYRPPAKDESGAADLFSSESMGAVEDLLRQDDDYNRHLSGSHQTLSKLLGESRANLLIVARSVDAVDDAQLLVDIELIARTNIRQLDTALKFRGVAHCDELRELELMRAEWASLLQRVRSPLSALLAKYEKFAATLKSLDQTCSISRLCDAASICSKEDATRALAETQRVQERLERDRDELRELLASASFEALLSEHSAEFCAMSADFDEAVARIGGLVSTLRGLDEGWSACAQQQAAVRRMMHGIEQALAHGQLGEHVADELQLCQERMDALETTCNLLTASLHALRPLPSSSSSSSSSALPDFAAELRVYSNALEQLRAKCLAAPQPRRRTAATQATADSPPPAAAPVVVSRLSARLQIACLLGAIVLSIIAFFFSYVYGYSFGPHLTYIRGPPPM